MGSTVPPRTSRALARAIEPLEPRRLLSTLAVVGTASADRLTLGQTAGTLSIKNRGTTTVTLDAGAGLVGLKPGKSRAFTGLTLVTADLGGGRDRLAADASVTVPIRASGGSKEDTLIGGSGRDELTGGRDNDLLRGGRGNDTLAGDGGARSGSDTIYGDFGNDSIAGGRGGDVLYGDDNDNSFPNINNHGNDTIRGGDGIDYIDGDDGSDQLFGDDGDDFFVNSDFNPDTLTGGTGFDRSDSDNASREEEEQDRYFSMESQAAVVGFQSIDGTGLGISGTSGPDRIHVTGTDRSIIVTLNGLTFEHSLSITIVEGESNNLRELSISGGDGNDTLSVDLPPVLRFLFSPQNLEGGSVVLNGGNGNDTLNGGLSTDLLTGGDGNDLLSGADNDDTLDGDAGTDTLSGGNGFDIATYINRSEPLVISLDGIANDGAAGENDRLAGDLEGVTGGTGNDRITGNDAANVLRGYEGNDTISGLGGNDTLGANEFGFPGEDGADSITGGAGDDAIDGGFGNDILVGQNGNDMLVGGVDNDFIYGGSGNDDLFGGFGNDRLFGEAGADRLFGEQDDDRLVSEDGATDLVDGGDGTDTGDLTGDAENFASVELFE